jgi:hypothetical protein
MNLLNGVMIANIKFSGFDKDQLNHKKQSTITKKEDKNDTFSKNDDIQCQKKDDNKLSNGLLKVAAIIGLLFVFDELSDYLDIRKIDKEFNELGKQIDNNSHNLERQSKNIFIKINRFFNKVK